MDIKDLALIYAGIVSTISLVWNIINEFRKERRKLKINVSLRNIRVEELTLAGDIRVREYPPALSVEITNVGKVKLSFDRPTFQLKFAKLEGQNYKLRIIIYDEKGKKYKSKWVYLKEIENVYEDFLRNCP